MCDAFCSCFCLVFTNPLVQYYSRWKMLPVSGWFVTSMYFYSVKPFLPILAVNLVLEFRSVGTFVLDLYIHVIFYALLHFSVMTEQLLVLIFCFIIFLIFFVHVMFFVCFFNWFLLHKFRSFFFFFFWSLRISMHWLNRAYFFTA